MSLSYSLFSLYLEFRMDVTQPEQDGILSENESVPTI